MAPVYALAHRCGHACLLQALDVVPRLRDPAWKARVDVCIRSMNQKSAQKSKEEKVAEMDPWCEVCVFQCLL